MSFGTWLGTRFARIRSATLPHPCPFRRPSMAGGRPPHADSLQPRSTGGRGTNDSEQTAVRWGDPGFLFNECPSRLRVGTTSSVPGGIVPVWKAQPTKAVAAPSLRACSRSAGGTARHAELLGCRRHRRIRVPHPSRPDLAFQETRFRATSLTRFRRAVDGWVLRLPRSTPPWLPSAARHDACSGARTVVVLCAPMR